MQVSRRQRRTDADSVGPCLTCDAMHWIGSLRKRRRTPDGVIKNISGRVFRRADKLPDVPMSRVGDSCKSRRKVESGDRERKQKQQRSTIAHQSRLWQQRVIHPGPHAWVLSRTLCELEADHLEVPAQAPPHLWAHQQATDPTSRVSTAVGNA